MAQISPVIINYFSLLVQTGYHYRVVSRQIQYGTLYPELFGTKRKQPTGDKRKLDIEQLRNGHFSPNFFFFGEVT